MKKLQILLAVTLCACVLVPDVFSQSTQPPSSTVGQSTQPPPSTEGWRMRLVPYLWGSGLKGRVGIGHRSADVDASFGDILSELNFAFMATFEANRERFTTLTDIVYMNLSDEHATPGPLFSSADAAAKNLILTPLGGYRIVGSENSAVDIMGGIRFWR